MSCYLVNNYPDLSGLLAVLFALAEMLLAATSWKPNDAANDCLDLQQQQLNHLHTNEVWISRSDW